MSGVITKAIQILDLLVPQGTEKEMSVTEIGKELNMPVQSVHRLLSSLAEHGFVAQNTSNKKYKLGLSIMKYGFLMWDSLMLRSVARPFMEELSQRTKETVYLSVRENAEGVYIDSVDSPQILKISEPIGLRLPLFNGASNRVILAFLQPALRQTLMDSFVWDDVPSLKPLTRSYIEQELKTIRDNGYAVTAGEATEGTTGIGAPIFSYENTVIGSINVAGPSIRFGEEQVEKYAGLAKKYAGLISGELGFRGRSRYQ
ncbi:DNA-binding IclR family transcriptional regulator [Paenibacillus phyllosphaerae]|uniref:DNA-binding IclR family transcriptional regulator n=1 Tax=Paenibacillus phyllosphaerae TaxID=274593 RepID=A0A7W5FNK0_9BACL|nr:IclR family transcriptional regulator [Paenibacillus phyllosphaerae]MBB3111400.1 DNA-binding IclR family transcriptional regulator [Paenibacillus phyllosphaerae]